MPLGDTVRRLRLEQAWSQRELARRAGISHQTIAIMESDPEHVPSLATIAKLAKIFKVRPNALLSVDEMEEMTQKKAAA